MPVDREDDALPAPAAMSTVAVRVLPEPVAPEVTDAAPVVLEVQVTPVRPAGMTSLTAAATTFEGPLLMIVIV